MSDGQSASAEPITMQEALAQANSRIDAIGQVTEAPQEEAPQEADEDEQSEEIEAQAEIDTDETDEAEAPEAEAEESEQILTADEYGDVLVDLNGTPTPLAEVLKGTLRQSDYTRKTMELSEQRKQLEAEAAERAKALDAREQQLQQLEAELAEPEPDWELEAENDPLGWGAKKAKWDKQQRAKAERQAEQQKRTAAQQRQFVEKTVQDALQVFPEWQDAEKFDEGADQRKQAALSLGFTAEEYNSTPDFRIAALLEKAARYDALQEQQGTRRAAAEKKIAKAPKVLKPGASKGDADPKQERRAAFQKRLAKPVRSSDIIKNLGLR